MLKDLLTPVVNGFKVLASEAKWRAIRGFRRWEIKQLEKRLAEEYQTLGKSYAQAAAQGTEFDPKTSDNDLTLRQITFLQEEIIHLEQDLTAAREDFVKKHAPTTEA